MKSIKWNEEKIKEAVSNFNEWQGKAVIMVDTSDGDVWTDVFANENDCKKYHSETICQLYGKDNLHGRNNKVTDKAIKELIRVESYKYKNEYDTPTEILEIFYRNRM